MVEKNRVDNKVYYVNKVGNNIVHIYNSKLQIIGRYKLDDTLCSCYRISNLWISTIHKNFAIKVVKKEFNKLSVVKMAIQNITKEHSYEDVGFKLFAQLPGCYTGIFSTEGVTKDNCMGVYIYTSKNMSKSIESTKEILDNYEIK